MTPSVTGAGPTSRRTRSPCPCPTARPRRSGWTWVPAAARTRPPARARRGRRRSARPCASSARGARTWWWPAAPRRPSTRSRSPDSRPCGAARDGFVLGEGAGIVILESAAHAAARGARAYAEAVGVGYSGDTYHLARPDPDAPGARLAMRRALADAAAVIGQDLAAVVARVVHVNAHATSTPAGDVAEARAIRAVLGARSVVTSTKSMTGHLLGAAGAVEAIAAILAMREGVVPPTINLDKQDPDIELDIAAGEPRKLPAAPGGRPLVLSNSFGFGGHNVTLVFSPPA